FKALFGSDDFIYLVMSGRDFFEPSNTALLARLAEDLKNSIPYVKDVRWFGNAEFLEGRDNTLIISALDDFIQRDHNTPQEARERILKEDLYRNFLFTSEAEVIGLNIDFEAYPEGRPDPTDEVCEALEAVLDKPEYQALGIQAVGPPILHSVYNDLSFSEAIFFLILGLAVMVVILYLLGRSFKDALVPLFIIILSIIWAMGLTEILGFTLNIYIILLPVLLCCACVGDSMHIIELFRQNIRQGYPQLQSLRLAMGKSGLPCFYTTLTTVAGFMSFQTSDIPPCRQMGVYASIGVLVAYVLSIVLVPLFYGQRARRPGSPAASDSPVRPPRSRPAGGDVFDRFMLFLYKFNMKNRKVILLAFAACLGLAAYGYSQAETESNTVEMLARRLPLRQAYDFVDRRIGGAMSVELILDSFQPDGVKEPDFLRHMEELHNFLENRPEVTKTVSILDIFKRITQALHNNDPAFYVLPDSRQAAAQDILLYETAGGRELDKLLSFDGRRTRLTARTRSLNTEEVRRLSEAIRRKTQEIFQNPRAVVLTGGLDGTRSMNDQMAIGQNQTFLAAFITLTLIMSLALRSLKLGFLSLVPNVIPVLATVGLAGAMGIYIDIPLMCFSPIIIGLIIDDTTHFLYRYRELFLFNGSYEQSLKETLAVEGRPLLFTTMTVTGAFIFLVLSSLSGVSKFGGFGALAFVLALAADFLLMPALLLTFKPFGPGNAKRSQQ
ncbi:MAG: MMPL family transporter, partial [Deltaproteobacteria bacterium]|nr:MMPL family transporter [Deltaproteobacteria bacterium]